MVETFVKYRTDKLLQLVSSDHRGKNPVRFSKHSLSCQLSTNQACSRGTTAHRSSKDPSDPKEVITISYHTGKGSRLLSIHAHDDGTWNEFFSRAGKNVGGGESSSSSSAQGTTTTDLTWRTNDQTSEFGALRVDACSRIVHP